MNPVIEAAVQSAYDTQSITGRAVGGDKDALDLAIRTAASVAWLEATLAERKRCADLILGDEE